MAAKKRIRIGIKLGALIMAGTALWMLGCATPDPIANLSPAYTANLARTAPAGTVPFAPGSETEQQALARIEELFNNYTPEGVRELAPQVYAEDAYFRDGFKELQGADAIVAYMVHGSEPLRECRFDFAQAVSSNGDYYLRWVMYVGLPSDPEGHLDEAVGMSHIRFNKAGQVIFQQDYWDPTDVLYRRIPVASWLIKKVKERL